MKSGKAYGSLRDEYGIIGTVQAAEITHGQAHGWHPHIHELAFLAGGLDREAFRVRMFERWRRACLKAGLGEPSEAHGFDVRGGEEAAGYVSKGLGAEAWDRPAPEPAPEPATAGNGWGLPSEVTKGHIKNGRGSSRSPFQILDCAVDPEALPEHREASRLLFLDYAEATKGRRQLSWSPGLRARFAVPELSDDEIAAEVGEESVLLASISLEDWYIIERNGLQPQVLSLAENGGAAAVFALIGAYRPVPV